MKEKTTTTISVFLTKTWTHYTTPKKSKVFPLGTKKAISWILNEWNLSHNTLLHTDTHMKQKLLEVLLTANFEKFLELHLGIGSLNVKAVQLSKYHTKYLFNDIITQVLSYLKCIPFTFMYTWHHLHFKSTPGQGPVFTKLPCTAGSLYCEGYRTGAGGGGAGDWHLAQALDPTSFMSLDMPPGDSTPVSSSAAAKNKLHSPWLHVVPTI